MHELFTAQSIAAFATLLALEVVLGVDNVVFIAIVTGRLPEEQRGRARTMGLALAAFGRIALLLAITWVMRLQEHELFHFMGKEITAKDLVLILGGVFLLAKSTWEIHHSLEGVAHDPTQRGGGLGFGAAIAQILMLDLVFSIDSVLTAVGMVKPDQYEVAWVPLTVMIGAVVGAIVIMLTFAGPLSRFVERHPTMKMLALAFLLLIGVVLVAEGLHQHIPRGYIYFSMAFSLLVEILNLQATARRKRLAGDGAAAATH
jgi:predicted tellurium resistance membrane protein TerC